MKISLRMLCCAALASLLGSNVHALNATDNVRINEVSYDPSESPEEPFEFVELFNAGGVTVFLDGAAITDEGNNGGGEGIWVFPGTPGGTTIPLAPGAYLLVVADATGSTLAPNWETLGSGMTETDDPAVPNLIRVAGTGVDLQLGNAGDGVTLSTGVTTMIPIPCGEMVDGVSWEGGGTGDVYAMSSTVCADPASSPGYANAAGELKTLQRCPNAVDTDNSTNDFSVANRTPKLASDCTNIAPIIAGLRYQPCFVAAAAPVTLSCSVTDENNNITSVRAFYRLDTVVPFDSLSMTAGMMGAYTASLPGQADQAHVQYYVVARDATGNVVKSPSTAPAFLRSYRVGLQLIPSLQTTSTPDSCSASNQAGKAVNVVGVVTHKAFEYSDNFFYIQNGIGPNSGIKVFTPTDSTFVPNMGDSVRVSGFISEFNCQTEVELFGDCGTVLAANRKVRTRTLASVAAINSEENESMLVTVQGPIDVDTAFDMTNLGSEFRVNQGTDIAYVGDDTFFPDGIGYSTVPDPAMVLDALTGIVGYRRVNTTTPGPRPNQNMILRLEPRRDNDVDRDVTDVGPGDDLDVVKAFHLKQNQPNPFNPVTTIEFTIPVAGKAALRIFDVQGTLVRTLFEREYRAAASDRVVWDGRDDKGNVVRSGVYFYKLEAGEHSATRKMLLLK